MYSRIIWSVLSVCLSALSCLTLQAQPWQPISATSPLLSQLDFKQQTHYRAAYSMERNLLIMSRPLQSSGELLLTAKGGITWQQQLPIVQTLVVAGQRVRQFDSKGQELDLPEMAQQIILAWLPSMEQVLQGEWSQLAKNFSLQQHQDASVDDWRLQLKPLADPLASMLKNITVEGTQELEVFSMLQNNGDQIIIRLIPLSPRTLSAQEQVWLND